MKMELYYREPKWNISVNITCDSNYPLTFGFVISLMGLIGSIIIELSVWIHESFSFVVCVLSVVGMDNASYRISAGGNVRWLFLFGSFGLSVIEILKSIN